MKREGLLCDTLALPKKEELRNIGHYKFSVCKFC